MRKVLVPILSVCLLALFIGSVSASDVAKEQLRVRSVEPAGIDEIELVDPGLRGLYRAAQQDTYLLVWYDFEPMDPQGWTRFDRTAQPGLFWHVDDFAGLNGGDFGGLVPREGTKSMWCGARPDPGDEYMCGWSTPPGYGDNWDQSLESDPFPIQGIVTVAYTGYFDSEAGWDWTYVDYDAGGGNWTNLATYDNKTDTIAVNEFGAVQLQTKIRFRFSSDGNTSDMDGRWSSDGGAIIDSIFIADVGGPINFEDFEGAIVGDQHVGIWHATAAEAFGLYGGLMNNIMEKDPCNDNFGSQWVWFIGSPWPSASYPGLFDTPFCAGGGGLEAPCMEEIIYSPVIDLTKYSTGRNTVQDADIPPAVLPTLGQTELRWTNYSDHPLVNLVFSIWYVRSLDPVTDCPSPWENRHFVTYGKGEYFSFAFNEPMGDLITSDRIQVATGCRDMCDVWYLVNGNCAVHTPAPYHDNMRLVRYRQVGPSWFYRDLDIAQDYFCLTPAAYGRFDAANDINPYGESPIRVGDSIVVECTAVLAGGLAEDGNGVRCYCNVRATDISPAARPNIYGPSLEGTVGHYISDDGSEWTTLRVDTAIGATGVQVEDTYMFDLNDSLFVRGYMIEYYFDAYDANGVRSTFPITADEGVYFEMSFLPTGGSDILYVDDWAHRPYGDATGIGYGTSKRYWDAVFSAVLPASNQPDVYQMNGPSSLVSNGCARSASPQLFQEFYNVIIWDAGTAENGTICDGTTDSDKVDDCTLLNTWMANSEHDVGLFVLGEGVAYDFDQHLTSPQALELMATWCGVDLVDNNYYELTGGLTGGGIVSPLITGHPNGIFYHGGSPDEFIAFGGCPGINEFDVLDVQANGVAALSYPDFAGSSYIAGVQAENTNTPGYTVKTMWFGFAINPIKDTGATSPMMRNVIVEEVLNWFNVISNPDITHSEVPGAYDLAQNFPNPFNPSTMIKFDMKAKGHVTLKVYNVAGQLVKTLVNGVKDAGSYTVTWDGTNNNSSKVASGVYFYKMDTAEYNKTLKMVLLR